MPHLAAIVSSLFAGVFMALYAAPNLSAIARRHLGFVLKSMAVFCDTLIFLLVGLALVLYVDNIDFKLAGVTILACLAGRVLQVFLLSAIVNRCRPRPIPLRFQAVMAHSGLRGAPLTHSLALPHYTQTHTLLTCSWDPCPSSPLPAHSFPAQRRT